MNDLSTIDLLFSFVITWTVGLTPPLLIRYFNHGEKLSKWPAVATCAIFWFGNIVLFTVLGSTSKTHGALLLIAYVSYLILTRDSKSSGVLSQGKLASWISSRIKIIRTLGGWDRILTVVMALWVVVSSAIYFAALHGNRSALKLLPNKSLNGVCTEYVPTVRDLFNPLEDSCAELFGPGFSLAGFSIFVLLPILVALFVRFGLGRANRWVKAGFDNGRRQGWVRTSVVVFCVWVVLVALVALVEYLYGGFIYSKKPLFTVFVPTTGQENTFGDVRVIAQISLARLLAYAVGVPAVLAPIGLLTAVVFRWVAAGFRSRGS